jgi:4-alpha-glucanotransferase
MLDSFKHRRTGVLLHPTSLPGPAAQGQLNQEAFNFIDFLHDSKVSIWQVLPLGPTHEDGSPYQSYSAFALNPKLLDLTVLKQWPFLPASELTDCLAGNNPLQAVYHLFMTCADQEQLLRFSHFKSTHQYWLEDYACYCCIKQNHGHTSWVDWPAPLRDREAKALAEFTHKQATEMDIIRFEQFVLYTIWHSIKGYATLKKIALFGDIPIFVAHDSADVWANRSLFHLDAQGSPMTIAGVPPDYFSANGQRWGNPHYCWQAMAKDDYAWWIRRLAHNLLLYDMVRIDHFRGLESFWEIAADEATAINGKWVKAPGKKLLSLFQKHFRALPIVAEDLGIITPEVEALRDHFHLPGMKVLQFAFDSDANNPYLPHNHVKCSVVYTGTHDNNTSAGWFAQLDEATRNYCLAYLNYPKEPMPWPLIQSALASIAQIAIIPMQDLLAGGSEQRMNTPGTTQGNWCWRFQWQQLPKGLSRHIEKLNILYGRNPGDSGVH